MDDVAFWREVRKRRNLFFLWWIGWPFGGLFLVGLYYLIFNQDAPAAIDYSVFFAWVAIWGWMVWRLKQLRCPRCGERAIDHPLFFMHHAKCGHCGFANSTENAEQEPTVK
jgi:ribosomal protein L37E